MIGSILFVFNTLVALFVWYRIGREKDYLTLVVAYNKMAKDNGRLRTIIEILAQQVEQLRKEKHEEIKNKEDKQ